MHGSHTDTAVWLAIGGALILSWFAFAILRWLDAKMFAKPQPQIEPDLIAESLRIVETPIALPGGRWGRYETKLVECAPPVGPSDNIHVPMDAKHRASCKRCQQEYERGARVPHAAN